MSDLSKYLLVLCLLNRGCCLGLLKLFQGTPGLFFEKTEIIEVDYHFVNKNGNCSLPLWRCVICAICHCSKGNVI